MFNGNSKGTVADISYTEFMQSLKKAKLKELKCNIQTLFIRLLGNIQILRNKLQRKAKIQNGLSIFDNRSTKSTQFKTTVLPNDSTVKEISEAAQAKYKVESLPESSTGVWISLLSKWLFHWGF